MLLYNGENSKKNNKSIEFDSRMLWTEGTVVGVESSVCTALTLTAAVAKFRNPVSVQVKLESFLN